MILHVVLYTPKPDLSAEDRERFHTALVRALDAIPSIRRYRVGRRLRLGTPYDAAAPGHRFVGVLEFDDLAGLQAYLTHPNHDELGRCFYEMSAEAFACDFEAVDRGVASALAAWDAAR